MAKRVSKKATAPKIKRGKITTAGAELSMNELRAVERLLESFKQHNNELSIADYADSEGVSRQLVYFQLANVLKQLALSNDEVFENVGHSKRSLSPRGQQLQDELSKLMDHYDNFASIGYRFNYRPSIRIGTTDTVSTRLLPIIRMHFEHRVAADKALAGTRPIIEQELGEPVALLRMATEPSALDFAFTFVPNTDSVDTEPDAICMPVECCMLCRHDHEFARPDQRAAIEDGYFDWKRLREQTVIKPRPNATLAAFPGRFIPTGVSKYIEVRTYLEAHAHVMMAKTVAFSHRLLMSDEELNYITPISLTKCGVNPVTLMLAPNVRRRNRHSFDDPQIQTCRLFERVVQERMDEYRQKTQEAKDLEQILNAYSRATHSSIISNGKDNITAVMHGELKLDIIPARMSPLGDKSPFIVCGYHRVDNLSEGEDPQSTIKPFPIHGRIHVNENPPGGGKQYHLMWQETEPGVAYGTVSFIFSSEELSGGRPLIGRWLGRSTWLKNPFQPAGGGIILHQKSDLIGSEDFSRLISEHHKRHPALDWPYGLPNRRVQ